MTDTFTTFDAYAVNSDSTIERRETVLPAACRVAPMRVTIAREVSHTQAARLLRRLADELEGGG